MAWEPTLILYKPRKYWLKIHKKKKKETSITMLAISMRQSRGYPRDKG